MAKSKGKSTSKVSRQVKNTFGPPVGRGTAPRRMGVPKK